MGCQFSSDLQHSNVGRPKIMKTTSKIGQMTLRICNFWLRTVEEKMEKVNNLFFKIRFSNSEQYFPLTGLNDATANSIKLPINSCSRPYGRFLIFQLWSHLVRDEKDAGFGIVLLDPLIQEGERKIIRCDLNYKNSPAGYLQVQFDFQEYSYANLSLKLYSLLLRTEEKQPNLFAKIIIGEQIFECEIQEENKGTVLRFKDKIHHFKVPSFLTEGEIKIIKKKGNSDIFRGKVTLNLKQILETREQYDGYSSLSDDGSINGRLKYSCLKGYKKNYHFQERHTFWKENREISLKVLDDNYTETQNNTKSTRDNGTENYFPSFNNMIEIEKMMQKRKLKKKMSYQEN